jgi:hypothetical protein
MANTIQIAVTLDSSGVVTGVQSIGKALDQLPAHANPAFQQMTAGQLKTRQELNELAYGFGVTLPGEVTKAIASVPALAEALGSLGEVAGIAVAIGGIAKLVNSIDDAKNSALSYGLFWQQFWQNIATGGNSAIEEFKTIAQEQSFLKPFQDDLTQFTDAANAAGKEGANAIISQFDTRKDDLSKLLQTQMKAAADAFGGISLAETDPRYQQSATLLQGAYNKDVVAAEQLKDAQLLALKKDWIQQEVELQEQADSAAGSSFQKLLSGEAASIQKLNASLTKQGAGFLIVPEDEDVRAKTDGLIEQQSEQWSEGTRQIVDQVNQQGLSGVAAISAKIATQVDAQQKAFQDTWGDFDPFPDPNTPEERFRSQQWQIAYQELQDRLTAINGAGNRERALAEQQITDQITDSENKAAIASLPPWQRANAQIVDDYNTRVRQIKEQEEQGQINSAQAAQFDVAAWQEANAQIVDNTRQTRDELAGQINSIFDDITSGNLSQAVLSELKHLFSEILAQWLLTLNGMKSAGGGGGILSSIVGSIFGFGGGGTQFAPVGEGAVPLFGSSLSASPALSLAGAAPLALSGLSSTSLMSGLTSPFAASGGIGALGLGSLLGYWRRRNAIRSSWCGCRSALRIGRHCAVRQYACGSTLEQSLAKIFPHGITIGGLKIGGAALAGLGAGVGLSSLTYGYQSGNPLLAGLGGAAGGALTGFSFGGPLGAVIGGAIGGIGGLLSGIFGGQKRHDEAETLIQGTLGPNITQILQSYKQFNTDQQDALSQLSDLETQAKQQLDQLGQDKLYWSELVPQVNSATDQINQIQGVRDQRSALNLAPPEFSTGGTVPGFGPVPIIAHGGEEIVRQPYAGMFRSELKARNMGTIPLTSGLSSSPIVHSEPHFHIHAIDANGVQDFFNKNGGKLRQAIRLDMLRNSNGGHV